MDIPEEHTFEFDNVSHKEIQAFIFDLRTTIFAHTKPLKNISCGIGGVDLIGGA